MAQWYEFKAWRDISIIPTNDVDPIEQTRPPPGEDVFFIQIRFRKVIRRHQQHLKNQLGGCQSQLVVEEEGCGPLIVKSFYVKRSDMMSRSDEVVFKNLRSMGVHPYPPLYIMISMMEFFQEPGIYPAGSGGVPHPNSLLSMLQAIRDFALSMLLMSEPHEASRCKVFPFVFGIANVTLEPAAASAATLERFSF